jgi:hypothetical protein
MWNSQELVKVLFELNLISHIPVTGLISHAHTRTGMQVKPFNLSGVHLGDQKCIYSHFVFV